MPGDSFVVRCLVHARRFLVRKSVGLGKSVVLGGPGTIKKKSFRKLAVRNAKGGKEAALYSKGVPGRESLVKGSPLAPRGRRHRGTRCRLTRGGMPFIPSPMPRNEASSGSKLVR